MTELVDHGTTGFLVDDADAAAQAVEMVGALDRDSIRASAVERFSVEVMVDRYVAVYRSLLAVAVR